MPVEALALGELARIRARDDDDVVAGGQPRRRASKASRTRRLTRLRSHGAADLARDGQPEARRTRRVALVPRAGNAWSTKRRLPTERPCR